MSLLFISHSSKDNTQSLDLHNWLKSKGWEDIFLDHSPERGLTVGKPWRKQLSQQIKSCDAMLLLISKNWLESFECRSELTLALDRGKHIFALLIDDIPVDKLTVDLQMWHLVKLCGGKDSSFEVILPNGDSETIHFSEQALEQFYQGLEAKGLTPAGFIWPPIHEPNRKPYQGLAPLQAEDAGIFFGRDADTQQLLSELEALRLDEPPRFLSILGASGAGKSSFMRAGILPRLARRPSLYAPLPIIRPEQSVINGANGLIKALLLAFKPYEKSFDKAQLSQQLRDNPVAVFEQLAQLAQLPKADALPTLVIAIDQAEELFTSDGKAEATEFLTLLNDIIHQDSVPVMMLCTIRSNSFEFLQSTALLRDVHQHTYSLQPIAKGAYQQIIEGPAKLSINTPNALKINKNLTQALLNDIENGTGKDALPLLAFTLEQLYNENEDNTLTLDEYKAMGRIEGAIEKAVEKALCEAKCDPNIPNDDEQCLALLKKGFIPRLAGIDKESREPKRKTPNLEDIPEASRPIIQYFIDNRLLSSTTTEEDGKINTVIEPAHESLLRQWGKLKGWLEEESINLITLDALQSSTLEWNNKANKRNKQWLNHKQGRLADAEALLKNDNFSDAISPAERDYLTACRQKERNSQRLLIAGFFFALILAGVAGVFAYWSNQNEQLAKTEKERANAQTVIANKKTAEANQQKAEANNNYALALNEKAVQAEKSKNTSYSSLYALHALNQAKPDAIPNKSSNILLKYRAEPKIIWQQKLSHHHKVDIDVVKFSPDKKTLVSVSGNYSNNKYIINLWDFKTGVLLKTMEHNSYHKVRNLSFSPNGEELVHDSGNRKYQLWNLNTGKKTRDFSSLSRVTFSPDGQMFAFNQTDKNISRWEIDKKKSTMVTLPINKRKYLSVISTDANLALAESKNQIHLWDFENKTYKTIPLVLEKGHSIKNMSISPDNKYLAFVSKSSLFDSVTHNDKVMLLDITKEKTFILDEYSGKTGYFAFSPNSQKLVYEHNKRIKIWKVATRKKVTNIHTSTTYGENLSFSNNGKLLASVDGKLIRLWDVNSGDSLQKPEKIIKNFILSSNFKYILSKVDDELSLFDITTNKIKRKVEKICNYSQISGHDDYAIFSSANNNNLTLWDVKEDRFLASFNLILPCDSLHSLNVKASRSGKKIIIELSNKIYFLDIEKQKVLFIPEQIGALGHVIFSRDENNIIFSQSQKDTNTIYITNFAKNKISRINFKERIFNFEFFSQGIVFDSAGSRSLYFLNDNFKKILKKIHYKNDRIDNYQILGDNILFKLSNKVVLQNLNSQKTLISVKNGDGYLLSPNGKMAVILRYGTGYDGIVILDTATGKIIYESDKVIHSYNFSDNSKLLATSLWDEDTNSTFIEVLDIQKNEVTTRIKTTSTGALKFSPDNNWLYARLDGKGQIWDISKNNKKLLSVVNRLYQPFEFVSNSSVLMRGYGKIVLKDLKTNKLSNFIDLDHNYLDQLAISTDKKIIALSNSRNILIFDAKLGIIKKKIPIFPKNKQNRDELDCLSFLNYNHLVFNDGKDLKILNINNPTDTKQFKIQDKDMYVCPFSTHKNKVTFITDKKIVIYDLDQQKIINSHTPTVESFSSPRFSQNGKEIAYLSNKKEVSLWIIVSNQSKKVYSHTPDINSLTYSPDGSMLAIGDEKGKITLLDSITFFPLVKLFHYYPIYGIKFSPDGNTIISMALQQNFLINIWDIKNIDLLKSKQKRDAAIKQFENLDIRLKGLSIAQTSDGTMSNNLYGKLPNKIRYPKDHPVYLRTLAEEGDKNAMLQLGIIEHRDSNWEKARDWYEKAREARNPDAEERLRILELTKQLEESEK